MSIFLCFFSSRRRHTRCALVTGVQTCALPICSVSPTATLVRASTIADHRELARLRAEGAVVLFEARGLDNELQRAALLGVDILGGRGDGDATAYIIRRVIGEALLAVDRKRVVWGKGEWKCRSWRSTCP